MVKKQNLNEMMSSVPSPHTTHTKIIFFLLIALGFSIFFYVSSVTYTGLAIMNSGGQDAILRNQNIVVSNRFEMLEISKQSNSVVDASIKSDVLLNVFAEIEDCQYWKDGNDKDNVVLYSINNMKDGIFKIGNPAEKTVQQLDLYKTDYLCLIFINREFPKNGNINLQYKETEVGKWNII